MTHLKFSIHCVKSPVYEEQCNSNVSRPVRNTVFVLFALYCFCDLSNDGVVRCLLVS